MLKLDPFSEICIGAWPDISQRPDDLDHAAASRVQQAPTGGQFVWRDEIFRTEIKPVETDASGVTVRLFPVDEEVGARNLDFDDGGTTGTEAKNIFAPTIAEGREICGYDAKSLATKPADPKACEGVMQLTWHGRV